MGQKSINSYQKIKAKNRDLTAEIYELVFKPDSYFAMQIKEKYKLMSQMEKAVMSGTHRNDYEFVVPKGSFFAQDKPLDEFLKNITT
jgi:hypothetical protein